MLLRGTELYERKEELGLIENYDVIDQEDERIKEDIPHVVSSPSFTYSDWKIMSNISEMLNKENKKN